jgi:hypothetical protein
VFLFAGVTGQAGLGNYFERFVLEGDNLQRVAVRFDVRLARPVTLLASRDLAFPTRQALQPGVSSMRKVFELIFVAGFAGLASDVPVCLILSRCRSRWSLALNGFRYSRSRRCPP